MANQEQLDLLKTDRNRWNVWRDEHPDIEPDLSRTNLSGANLNGANLCNTDLREANLSEAQLIEADLSRANLDRANLSGADLSEAHLDHAFLEEANLSKANLSLAVLNDATLRKADLREADFRGATLLWADLRGANLSKTDLSWANLSDAKLNGAQLVGCRIYAISAWDVELEKAKQEGLIITSPADPVITVDNLEVAQFIYLLLNNQKIRDVIDTIGKKGVLILGRFSQERKLVLDALREKLRDLNYLPIVFDFEHPTERDFTETIMTLAGLCRFIIADITNPSSAPLELQATIPNYMIPFVPIIQQGEKPFAMFRDLQSKYSWVLDTLEYDTSANLIRGLERAVVEPAIVKHKELMEKKVAKLPTRHIGEYL